VKNYDSNGGNYASYIKIILQQKNFFSIHFNLEIAFFKSVLSLVFILLNNSSEKLAIDFY
jgi:hypothetical protein